MDNIPTASLSTFSLRLRHTFFPPKMLALRLGHTPLCLLASHSKLTHVTALQPPPLGSRRQSARARPTRARRPPPHAR